MWILVVFICTCFGFLYYRMRLPLRYWKDRGIPHPTPSMIVGNLGSVVFNKEIYTELFQRTCTQYKELRYFGFYNFLKPSLVILDTELIKQMFIKNFEHFTDHSDLLPKDVDTFWKKGIFARDGVDWQTMRTTLSPTFTSRKLKAMFYLVVECSERFVNHFIKKNSTITLEIMDAFIKLNNDIIASCTFGIHCDSLENENNEFYLTGKEAFDFSGLKAFKLSGNSISPTLSRLLGLQVFSKKIRNFFIKITKETIDYRKRTGSYPPDLIHLLIEAQKGILEHEQNKDHLNSGFAGKQFSRKLMITDEDIASQAVMYFFGSYDTMSSVLTHTIYELVGNVDAQTKLRNEIDCTLNKCNGKITYEALFEMKYLDMVLSESLRLWPPVPILNRICVKPYVIEANLPGEKSFVVEPGTEILVSALTWHKNPECFENPDKFDPERFSDENKKNLDPCTYFPFGIGPRHCLGKRFALMVMKLVIVNLLTHFEIIPVEKTVIPIVKFKSDTSVKSAHGYWFGLKPRTDKSWAIE